MCAHICVDLWCYMLCLVWVGAAYDYTVLMCVIEHIKTV